MHILFDLDGTLTDSGPGIIHCAKDTFIHYGIPVPDETTLRTMVGPPLRESFARFGIAPEEIDEAVAYYRSLYQATGKYENTPYPGIQEVLKKLRNDGHKLYVATSKPEHMAIDILEHFGLAPYFCRICGSCMDGVRDKKEAVIACILEDLAQDEKVMMVGDTVFDVLGANFHGIPTVVVGWGYGDHQAMLDAGAKRLVHTMDELSGCFDE